MLLPAPIPLIFDHRLGKAIPVFYTAGHKFRTSRQAAQLSFTPQGISFVRADKLLNSAIFYAGQSHVDKAEIKLRQPVFRSH
jgi:hypothetical protein